MPETEKLPMELDHFYSTKPPEHLPIRQLVELVSQDSTEDMIEFLEDPVEVSLVLCTYCEERALPVGKLQCHFCGHNLTFKP